MIDYLKQYPGMFDAAELELLAAAFDKAWTAVKASGAYPDYSSERARALLARHIIEKAKAGERNPEQLCESALAHLAQEQEVWPPVSKV